MSGFARRVMVVDDDPFTRSLVESLLQGEGFGVAAAADAAAARALLGEFDPDLVVLDVNLGNGPTGLQLGFIIERTRPDVAIMYLTRYPTALLSSRDGSAHLQGKVVVTKDDVTDTAVLLQAIEQALRGRQSTEGPDGDEQVGGLTVTQREVLQMMAAGMTNAAIARRRSTSERAVEKQVKAIYEALGLEANQETNARVLAAMKYAEVMGDSGLSEQPAVHG
jgi:DNA-binding NarL/FixJ family response regulator